MLDVESSPLVAPRLHPDVLKTVWDAVKENPSKTGYEIEITVPGEDLQKSGEVTNAFENVFMEQSHDASLELREIYRQGRRTLFLGILGVALLLGLAEALLHLSDRRTVAFVSETLVILAWVLLWTPAELLVYSPWPVRHRCRQAREIAKTPVRLIAADHPNSKKA